MGRRLPPRVTYWTGVWDPAQEAISKEITALRSGSRARAPVVAFSAVQGFEIDWSARTLVLPSSRWRSLRAAAALIEPLGAVSHVFGGQVSWHLLRALGRRPILMTAVTASTEATAALPVVPSLVAVETEELIDAWVRCGVKRDRVRLIRPGIDLDDFQPRPVDVTGRFSLLFASTPSDPADIARRGIPLLIELARSRPDVEILVPWRQWGDVAAARRRLDALQPPANFVVTHEARVEMPELIARVHATIACFAPGAGKSVPNFVLEGLAGGRPCILTTGGISDLVAASGAGLAVPADLGAVSSAVDRLRAEWPARSLRARETAKKWFDLRRFRSDYDTVYEELSARVR